MRRVLVDIDGVIVDMLGALKRVLAEDGFDFKPENVETYDFKGDIGCPREEVFKRLKHIAVFREQKLYDGVEESLEILKNTAEVWAYTKVEPNPFIMCERTKMIQNLGMKGSVYVGDSSKESEKPVYLGFDAVFEDSYGVLTDWSNCMDSGWKDAQTIVKNEKVYNLKSCDTKLFLINHTYNHNAELGSHIIRCKDFSDAVNKYVKEYI